MRPAASGEPGLGSLTSGYYPLTASGPAQDLGDDGICAAYPTDQAGGARPATDCNAGAVESSLAPTDTPEPTDTPVPPDTVDVWGWVKPTVKVCFPQAGSAILLDAATAPRTVSPIASYLDGIYTCVEISKAGTVTLVAADSGRSTPPIARDTELPLSNCMVTTQYNLNLRHRPNGTVLLVVPYGATLTVYERASGWFKVDYHGERGWLSADYVRPVGACG